VRGLGLGALGHSMASLRVFWCFLGEGGNGARGGMGFAGCLHVFVLSGVLASCTFVFSCAGVP
jgi:hypothetical protein